MLSVKSSFFFVISTESLSSSILFNLIDSDLSKLESELDSFESSDWLSDSFSLDLFYVSFKESESSG